jgi:hypothetical protein
MMGITFGDHLIDSGYRDITAEQEREIEDQRFRKERASMTDERLLANPYEIDGTEYELWCDRYGNWALVRDGEDADLTKFTEQQINRISQDVFELRAP